MRSQTLSHEQTRFYRDQGYYKLANVYSAEETSEMRHFVKREAGSNEPFDKSNPTRKLYRLYDRDPILMHRIIGNAALKSALVSLLGPNVVFVKNRHNHATINKYKGEPAEGIHRDILQPTRGLMTAAIYLQDSTTANGATRIIPGSHKFPYVGVPQPNGGGTWMQEHEEYSGLEDQAISIEANKGDVLLFDGTLFHGVGSNPSGRERISMTLGFRSVDELCATPDIDRCILVTGNYIYRGNDIL